ncbi:MAG TPA: Zn-ribbon domain-containing OB-fold protein [Acidimicrobiia bacterium]|nr:Zn-ribbon domain-containing OB-fold protein [Acidimicrobiia bacterium]
MSSRPVQEGLFDDHGLIGGRCGACGRHHFPAAVACPYCGAAEVARVELSETGTLWGWTAVTAAPPGYAGEVPFGFGVVELPEGLRVISRIEEADPARLSFGAPVRFALAPLHTDDDGTEVVTYAFTPSERT